MIGTELLKGQGLGNSLFCYITARCIAEKQGEKFSVLGKEILEDGKHPEQPGLYFMNLDFGEPTTKQDFKHVYKEKEDRLFLGNSVHDMTHGCYITGVDEAMLVVEDSTLLYGNMQAEEYFLPYKEEIKKWFAVKEEYDSHEYTKDNLCILNVRGGEYAGNPELFVERNYWLHAMDYMKTLRNDMEFMIVTDDVKAANKLLPEIPAYHFTLDKDYVTVKNAKYLILSNSSFAFFPAFTSETVEYILAPKYWARHNVSNGYWASEQNIYSIFHYMDRKGNIFTAEECRRELVQYKERTGLAEKINCRPGAVKAGAQKIRCRYIRYKDLVKRIPRAIKRRLKG